MFHPLRNSRIQGFLCFCRIFFVAFWLHVVLGVSRGYFLTNNHSLLVSKFCATLWDCLNAVVIQICLKKFFQKKISSTTQSERNGKSTCTISVSCGGQLMRTPNVNYSAVQKIKTQSESYSRNSEFFLLYVIKHAKRSRPGCYLSVICKRREIIIKIYFSNYKVLAMDFFRCFFS